MTLEINFETKIEKNLENKFKEEEDEIENWERVLLQKDETKCMTQMTQNDDEIWMKMKFKIFKYFYLYRFRFQQNTINRNNI